MSNLLDALACLEKHWNLTQFRPAQQEAISHALEGDDVLAILPTAYGKSLCFQIPAMLGGGITIVFSPLIALIKDQVDACNRRGIPARALTSHSDNPDRIITEVLRGDCRLLYVAPERLISSTFRDVLQSIPRVDYVVVDECHCVATQGHDFRPAYSNIRNVIPLVTRDGKRPPILAFTATATAYIEQEIAERIGFTSTYTKIVGDPVRPNFTYDVLFVDPDRVLREMCREWGDGNRHIVYSPTRKGAETIADDLRLRATYRIGVYHAGFTPGERTRAQEAFVSGDTPVVVATCAFGMGIDVPNIRTVVHAGIPDSVENYQQESGRAGRDGLPARAILFATQRSVSTRQYLLDMAHPPYALIQGVWAWLHENASPGEVLSMSAETIACELQQKQGMNNVNDAHIRSALSILETHQLLQRFYAMSGVTTVVRREQLNAYRKQRLPEIQRAVLLAIEDALPSSDGEQVQVAIDRHFIADQCGVTVDSVQRQLKLMESKGVLLLQAVFRGKSMSIPEHVYGRTLSEVVNEEAVVRRRQIAQRRLADVIAYTRATDRVAFIRGYFNR